MHLILLKDSIRSRLKQIMKPNDVSGIYLFVCYDFYLYDRASNLSRAQLELIAIRLILQEEMLQSGTLLDSLNTQQLITSFFLLRYFLYDNKYANYPFCK